MTPIELLKEVRRRLAKRGAWVPRNNPDGRISVPGGCGCVLNHLWWAHDESPKDTTVYMAANQAWFEMEKEVGDVPNFNDSQKSVWPVLALVSRAIARLEAK